MYCHNKNALLFRELLLTPHQKMSTFMLVFKRLLIPLFEVKQKREITVNRIVLFMATVMATLQNKPGKTMRSSMEPTS
jgi:hypothetical protein